MNTAIKALIISDFRNPLAARPEAEIFLGLHKRGVEIEVMTFSPSEYANRFIAQGILVHDFSPHHKFDSRDTAAIRTILLEGKHDVLHLLTREAITSGIRAARGLNTKVVVYRGSSRRIPWYDPLAYLKYLHPRVDKIVCNSLAVAQMFQRQPFLNKSKITVIHKGHALAWYDDVLAVDREKIQIPDSARIVCCVANVRRVKGVPILLNAIHQMPLDPEIHFLMIGHGMDTPTHHSLLPESAMRQRVHFIGHVDNALSYIAASDVLVLPSLFSESLTKAVLEAMALGIAPIITDLPGNAEALTHEESGLKVPARDPAALANAILRLCGDDKLRVQLGANAREHIKTHLSHQQTVEQMHELYKELTVNHQANS